MLLQLFVRVLQSNLFSEKHFPTIDIHALLRSFPQSDKQEGRITYPSPSNSELVEIAGNCC
jgi:hypothetical protein